MNLTDNERLVISCIQHRADEPLASIAKITGLKIHNVRYAIKRLQSEGLITRRASIDIYRLGYSKHAFFFSLSKIQTRAEIIKHLNDHPNIAYVAEVGGEYRFKADICSRNHSELYDFLNSFSEKFGDSLRDKAFVQLIEQSEFSVKCLSQKKFPIRVLRMGISSDLAGIDDVDHKILGCISEANDDKDAQIARKVGIPTSSLAYRLDQLQKKQILLGYRYLVNGAKLGLSDYYHLLYIKGLRASTRNKLYEYATSHPNIRYFVPCIGAWDLEIGSNVENAEQAAKIADDLFELGGDAVLRIQTLPLFRYTKVSNYPFLSSSLRQPS